MYADRESRWPLPLVDHPFLDQLTDGVAAPVKHAPRMRIIIAVTRLVEERDAPRVGRRVGQMEAVLVRHHEDQDASSTGSATLSPRKPLSEMITCM